MRLLNLDIEGICVFEMDRAMYNSAAVEESHVRTGLGVQDKELNQL